MPRFPAVFPESLVVGCCAGGAVRDAPRPVLGLPSSGGAVTFTVTRTDDQLDSSPGDGLCSALNGGGCSLRAAVQEANALSGADGIYLPPGTYSLTLAGAGEDFAASGDLDITSAITLLGTGWAVTTIAMVSYADRLFDIQGFSGLELGDVTLTGGSVDGVGGGIQVRTGGTLAVRRSRIQGCLAHHGGAIGTLGGNVTIEDAELSGNWALSDPPTWYVRRSGGGGLRTGHRDCSAFQPAR